MLADEVEKRGAIISPYKTGLEFDALSPRLGSTELSATDRAKLFLRTGVHDKLLPLVLRGWESESRLKLICEKLLEICSQLPKDEDTVMSTAVEEMKIAASFLKELIAPDMNDKECLQKLDAVMSDRSESGAKQLVLKAVQEQTFYLLKEKDLRKNYIAYKSLMPEIEAASKKLSTGDLSSRRAAVSGTVPLLAVWMDSLPGHLEKVYEGLQKTLAEALQEHATDAKVVKFTEEMLGKLCRLRGPHLAWAETMLTEARQAASSIEEKSVVDECKAVVEKIKAAEPEDVLQRTPPLPTQSQSAWAIL